MEHLSTDKLKELRRIAYEQRRVCLPLDKPGWDKIKRQTTDELEKRGIICHPWPKQEVQR